MDSLMDIYGSCSTAEPFTRGGKKKQKTKTPFVLQYWWQKQALPLPFKGGGEKKKKAEHVWFVHDYDTFALTFLGERFWFDS